MKILVVEDQELNVDMIMRRLQRRGFAVDVAMDGESALKKLATDTYDIVLLDISLPGISGFEVADRMKTQEITRDTPVIALTAHALQGDNARMIAAGFDGYAAKPIDFDGLMIQISRLVKKEKVNAGHC